MSITITTITIAPSVGCPGCADAHAREAVARGEAQFGATCDYCLAEREAEDQYLASLPHCPSEGYDGEDHSMGYCPCFDQVDVDTSACDAGTCDCYPRR